MKLGVLNMQEHTVFKQDLEERTQFQNTETTYHSVVFTIEGLDSLYQFKLWRTDSLPMCFLMRQDSELSNRLKVGDKLNTRYYCDGSAYPDGCCETTIQAITKSEQGRFKGHYLVGLEISQHKMTRPH